MPTDEHVNASASTVEPTPPQQPELTDDLIASIPMEKLEKSHPGVKDLKTKHSAARQGMDKANIEKNAATVAAPSPNSEEDTLWLIDNAADVKLVKEEFASYKAKGYSRDDALRLAKLDKGINPRSRAENVRQASTASATAIIDRSGEDFQLTDTDKRLNVKPDTIEKNRALVEG